MALVPISSHGFSSGGGTITGRTVIAKSGDNVIAFEIIGAAGQTNDLFAVDSDTAMNFAILPDGSIDHIVDSAVNDGIKQDTNQRPNAGVRLHKVRNVNNAEVFCLNRDGYLGFMTHAAPDDAEVAAGECYLWFDQTDGVGNTKLMVKGKSADGTVKTATVLLA